MVKVGNGHFIKVKSKRDVLIDTPAGTKLVSNVFFVPEIDGNLLNIAQLLEKGYSVMFKGKESLISDPSGSKLMSMTLANKSFVVDWNKNSDTAYTALTKGGLVENFSKSVEKEDVCKLVHADVCGLMKTLSLNGSRYFIMFIDDYLRTKYTSAMFQGFCNEAGIKHQLTNTYTPQQNGTLWAEAVNTAVYLQNRLPTKALVYKTLFEAWFGFKPSVAHLRVFGCIFHAHVPTIKRDKLAKKAQPGILVGYGNVKKGYRVLDPSSNKVFMSRDVVFNEKSGWNWDKNEPKTATEDPVTNQIEADQNDPEMDIDDVPVRGIRPLAKIYERTDVAAIEPNFFEEAKAQQGWKQTMLDELSMIEKNQTWELVAKRANRKVIGVKWVFRAKYNADGTLNKLKPRMVVKGFRQKYGINYLETFAPVARLDTIRLLVALAVQKQWQIHQLDVKLVFLNGFLDEEIYVEQPEGFKIASREDNVYKLKKALYGLQQTLGAWYDRIDSYIASLGFERSISEPTLYVKKDDDETQLIVSLYVDDLLVTGGNNAIMANFKGKMDRMFAISLLSRFIHCCNVKHLQAAKRVLRYIKGTLNFGMMFTKVDSMKLLGYANSDWVGSVDDMKTAGAVNQAIWLRKIMADLNIHQREATEIKCDNQSTIAIAKNLVFHGRTKHFKIKFYFVREMEQAQEVKLFQQKAMYGDESAGLLAQIVVLQSLIWYNLLLCVFEFNAAKPASKITPTSEDIEDTEAQGEEGEEEAETRASKFKIMLIFLTVEKKLVANPNTHAAWLGLIGAGTRFSFGISITVYRNSIAYVTVTTACTLQSRIALFEYSHFSQGYISRKCACLCSNPGLPHMIDLTRSRIACGIRMTAVAMVMKFMAGPALIAASSAALGLRGRLLRVGIVQVTLPPGVVPFVFAKEFDVHPDILSTGVTFGMLIALPVALIYYLVLAL
ncbi:hypothetical protein CXB51_026593 [Gossypium anomalum]|uniref:Reverse transcriptase Ty1/copia-type domain-containing protein n=1 Tax=Gossypium anomalum TaxID=47600 RepID=A0A8J5YED2_9ROSI|nr:hypothetical protein CXB51_026593 [Gossypium anomalum]